MELGIDIDEEFRKHFGEEWLQGLVERCLRVQGLYSEVELSLLITAMKLFVISIKDIEELMRPPM